MIPLHKYSYPYLGQLKFSSGVLMLLVDVTTLHTWSSGQPTVQRPWSSRGLPAGAGIRTHNLGLPQVSSPTLYPLGQRLPCSLHLTHPKRIHTWGQPLYGAWGAVPCSRALQSQYLPARDSNLRTSGYRSDSLTIRPRLPLSLRLLR